MTKAATFLIVIRGRRGRWLVIDSVEDRALALHKARRIRGARVIRSNHVNL